MRRIALIALIAATFLGCTTPTTPAGPDIRNEITINFAEVPAETGAPTGPAGSVTLSEESITVAVGRTVNVEVTARENGQEIPSANITVNILDKTIARFAGRTDRTIQIEGLAAGKTEAIVTAAGFQASLSIFVE